MKRWKSLQLRLVGTHVALALLLLTFAVLVFSRALASYAIQVEQQRQAELMSQARELITRSQGTPEETVDSLASAFPELRFATMNLVGASAPGSMIYWTAPESDEPQATARIFARTPTPPPTPRLFGSAPDQSDSVMIVVSPRYPEVGISITPRQENPTLLRTLYREVGLLLAVGVGLAVLLGWWFSRRLAYPVERLTQATAAVAAGDFGQQVPATGTPELDRLADQFNQMSARLDSSFRSLQAERDMARRFAADAAHELKTPLTALRAFYELAEKNPSRSREIMEPLGRQIDRVERIMASLLQLARLSEGSGFALTPVDAEAAVEALAPSLRAYAEEYGHQFRFEKRSSGPFPVMLEPRLLELVLVNLWENACKFTPPGGLLQVRVGAQADQLLIDVEDNGPGIPPDELPHLFERFHRGITTQDVPGSGLGLSIAQEAAQRLGGTIAAESEPGRGSRFTLTLPLLRKA